MRMHADQVDVGAEVVAALVAAQFPQWRGRPVSPLRSHGTVNALFRLGDEIVLRFPLQPSLDADLRAELLAEQDNARRIAPRVPLAVPEPLGFGEPGDGYPGPWTVYRWIPGETVDARRIGDLDGFARDLAGFVNALHAVDTEGRTGHGRGRGGPLHVHDDYVRRCLAESHHLTDTTRLARIWTRCLDAPPRDAADAWIHADLMPGNLLVRHGRLAAVIDLETVRIGDPAVDLMPAWNLLTPGPRATYRRALGVDDATWERGRGWALLQAIAALPYYVDTNPVMADTARHTLDALLRD
ncbi:aminoglycoside phosphotransferase (APT) family kinase protein [Plantactinospora soyae]|uniref:Aminoglycoside phosphotransferase (APT) family kinase protein n=2 Tax=Plantactinospora soyae TaxID=1544732 RepID=A0A927QZC7_9ACTN|nr:aminoglycoside phosphotransferase (APT) family kinase protein [Plantactinospora soyae]